jgi:prepilin-type N-terminal cleavage/methylation domain-containing protein
METSKILVNFTKFPHTINNKMPANNGFTLLELLVAVVIGSLVIAAVGGLFLVNTNTFKTVDDSSRLQENGRFALQTIARAVHQAGYAPVDVQQLVSNGKDAFPSNLDGITGATVIAGRNGVGPNASDTLTIAFRGAPRGATTAGQMLDCAGNPYNIPPVNRNAATAATLSAPVVNRFYINTANAGAAAGFSLWCDVTVNGALTGRYELITGVESFQVLYGVNSRITTTTAGGSSITPQPDYYTSANNLSGIQFRAIRGVQVALVLRGAELSTLDVARTTTTINVFGSQADRITPLYNGTVNTDPGAIYTIQSADRLRTFRVVTSTIELRNGAI